MITKSLNKFPNKVKEFKFIGHNKEQCIFDGKKYNIERKRNQYGHRYFKYDEVFEYSLIEDELNSNNLKHTKYSYCIFLKIINIEKQTFNNLDFSNSLFIDKVTLQDLTFNSKVDFYNSTFLSDVKICNVNFLGDTNFMHTIFKSDLYFHNVYFKRNLSFENCDFAANAWFADSEFIEEVNFNFSVFEKLANFQESKFNKSYFNYATFNGKVIFAYSEFKNTVNFKDVFFKDYLDLRYIIEDKSCVFDFSGSHIESLNYSETKFNKFANRETALFFKEHALKQNDQIRALEFYKKEMDSYCSDLNEEKNWTDLTILKFEKWFSNYGTDPLIPIIYILLISFIFSLFISYNIERFDISFNNSLLLINPTLSVSDIFEITLPTFDIKKIPSYLEIINLFKNIFFAILIYETIKSFRKFSRKL